MNVDRNADVKADLRFPVGQPELHLSLATEKRPGMIETIALLPKRLAVAVAGLSAAQLETLYRPGGWTVRQVVHHLPDSHMNAYVRFKLALTEDAPTIKPYDEARWAELPDGKMPPTEISLMLLEGLHKRWVLLMDSMTAQDWARKLTHPERGQVTLDENLCLYEWHCRHHVAHITRLREREGF
jgi:hypothetical protein